MMARINQWRNARIQHWLNKRIPAKIQHVLNQRNIFILPSRFGFIYLTLCCCLFILGSNYQNNLMLLLCYFLLAVFLLHLFMSFSNFAGLTIQIGKVSSVFCNEQVQLPLWITNGSSSIAHGKLQLHLFKMKSIDKKGFAAKQQQIIDLDNFDNPASLSFKASQRGVMQPPRITLSCYFPLGLIRCWTHLAMDSEIVVYPSPLPCALSLSEESSDDQQATGNSSGVGQHEFDRLRPYTQGEPLNQVAWKQYAQGRGLFTKAFTGEQGRVRWLNFNNVSAMDVETQLSQLCYMAVTLSQSNQTFGLRLPNHTVEPQSGQLHLQACLNALARF
ncbi:DUF58 domain-containing protein [Alteromonadaceae bacterium BrNp21-10]|nr:DUF58 domain-containing protein [Alteromonadaceae bacterium BrNp21-10]